ncbi:MAG: protein DpdH [Cyanobacteriota bacterium]|nr:protein DpdH [Cyanobacteriota bacterium]
MTFQNFVCWSIERVRQVMNVEATQPSDRLFLATHHPAAMKRGELIQGGSEFFYTEEEFLRDFLAAKDFAFVPVLGSAGTGKSHLIRWLATNIESTATRKVLLVPKINTNLKDIIEKILNLEGIEGAKFDEYRQRLHRATSSLTEAQARTQLLNQLAAAVGDGGQRDRSQLTDLQDYLVDELDSFLYDPFFREHWLEDEGIIHRLVIHTLGRQDTVEVVEERRAFSVGDLPLNVLNLEKAGAAAKDFYGLLIGDEDVQKATVDWLNRHLDEAMTQVLSLGREDLQRLMREVRETLVEQGIELVFLIEDFAKLQGIDREVLEAVLARPQQPGNQPLCAIRTALACTTGYFESLMDTVQQRVTFSVNLDIGEVSEGSPIAESDVRQFVARYLNAVRLPDEKLQDWENERKANQKTQTEPPSFCRGCEHRKACHAGFGAINEIGLYPLTPMALKQMLSRVNSGNFNPRILIQDVLKYTLETSGTDIQQGSFPAVSLREHFGKLRLSAIVQNEIRAKDSLNASRREVLLDLWTDRNELVDLPVEVHAAFNLPPLGVTVQPTKPLEPIPRTNEPSAVYRSGQKPSEKTDKISDKLDRQLKNLDNWNNQGILPQDVDKELREFIYPAVIERIEWDTELLLRGSFAGNSQIFKQRNVIFHSPKVTRGTYAGIVLSLPLNPEDEDEFRETAIAFQGILQYSYYKNWTFANGDRYFRAYAKQLERWSQYMLEEIRRRPRVSGEWWNPVPTSVELLAIAAKMSRHPTNSLEDLVNALFLELEDSDKDNRAKSWKELFNIFQKNCPKLSEIVRSRIACTKGSSSQFQIIDAVQVIDPLQTVRKDWQPHAEVPGDLRSEYEVIQKVRQKTDELLLNAIEEERDRQLGVYQSLVEHFGEDFHPNEAVETIQMAITEAQNAGIVRGSTDRLVTAIDNFKRAPISKYVKSIKGLQTEDKIGKLLQILSEDYQRAMTAISEFIEKTDTFLDTSLNTAEQTISKLQAAEESTVELSHRGIEVELSNLRRLVTEIKG